MKQVLQQNDQKSGRIGFTALALIIIIQCVVMIFLFTTQKNIYNTDEYYSYGISNSFRQPFLYADQLYDFSFGGTSAKESITNNTEDFQIRTGDDFKYYLRTKPETSFRYDSVWYNASIDTTPPLYYLFIHTLSSFHPEQHSWYDGFALNMVCLVITQIFVYLLAYQLSRSRWTACLTVAFWGFTLGGISCFIFIRMYSMLTMFAMIYAYQSISLHRKEKCGWKTYAAIVLTVFLGALTHHNFLVYAFFCTAFSCIFFLLQKKFKRFFTYGFSALGGVVLSILAFPATISHLMIDFPWSGDASETNDGIFFHSLLKKALFGYDIVHTDWWLYLKAFLIVSIPIIAVLLIVFHRKPFVKSLLEKCRKLLTMLKTKLTDPQEMNPGGIILLLTIFSYFYIITIKSFFWDLLGAGVRYMYIILPLIMILLLSMIAVLIRKIPNAAKITVNSVLCVGLAALLVYQHSVSDPDFMDKTDVSPQDAAALVADQDCIALVCQPHNEQCIADVLADANTVIFSLFSEEAIIRERFTDAVCELTDKQQPLVILMDVTNLYTEKQRNEDLNAGKDSYSFIGSEYGTIDEDSADKLTVDVNDYDTLRSESGVVRYLEKLTGYSAEKVYQTRTQNFAYILFQFTPSAE